MKRIHFIWALALFTLATSRSLAGILIAAPVFLMALHQLSRLKTSEFMWLDMFWLCVLFYFGIAPAQGLSDGRFVGSGATAGMIYSPLELFISSTIVYVFLLTFSLAHNWAVTSRDNISQSAAENSPPLFIYSLIAASALLIYIVLMGGVGNVMSPRTEKSTVDESFLAAPALALAVVMLTRYVAAIKSRGLHLVSLPLVILAFGLLGLCVNFTNAPRFFIVATWLPLFLTATYGRFRFSHVYLLFVAGLFLVMPVLSYTTRFGLSSGLPPFSELFGDASILLIKDVDIFETLTHSVRVVSRDGFFFGDNLLAVFLFFFPRSVWVGKPLVGGLVVGQELYDFYATSTPNLSFFIAGDAYLDFGYFGVVALGFLLGFIGGRLTVSTNRYFGIPLLAILLLSSLPILLRGPVGAVIGYPLCVLVICLVVDGFSRNTTLVRNE